MLHLLQIVSFPKSGRTWLRVMLDDIGISAIYTHDGSGYEDNASIVDLNPDKTKYAASPVLLVARDPRDIVVSGYFQVTRRLRLEGANSMSHFIRNERYGIEKVVQFNLQWFAAARQVPRFAILRYEELHKDTARTLSAVAQFAGSKLPAATVKDVVSRRSFAQMQRLEANGGFKMRYGSALLPMDPDDPESYKVRRGKIGGYIDYLSGDDIIYCNRVLDEAAYWPQLQGAIGLYGVLLSSFEESHAT